LVAELVRFHPRCDREQTTRNELANIRQPVKRIRDLGSNCAFGHGPSPFEDAALAD
jgi:hypothetical protein